MEVYLVMTCCPWAFVSFMSKGNEGTCADSNVAPCGDVRSKGVNARSCTSIQTTKLKNSRSIQNYWRVAAQGYIQICRSATRLSSTCTGRRRLFCKQPSHRQSWQEIPSHTGSVAGLTSMLIRGALPATGKAVRLMAPSLDVLGILSFGNLNFIFSSGSQFTCTCTCTKPLKHMSRPWPQICKSQAQEPKRLMATLLSFSVTS